MVAKPNPVVGSTDVATARAFFPPVQVDARPPLIDVTPTKSGVAPSCGNCTAFEPAPIWDEATMERLARAGRKVSGRCLLNPVPVQKTSAEWCRQHELGASSAAGTAPR